MGFLTKTQILYEIEKKNIIVQADYDKYPFEVDHQVQEASIDLRLSDKYYVYKGKDHNIDTRKIVSSENKDTLISSYFTEKKMSPVNGIVLAPNKIIFSTVYEKVSVPEHLVGLVVARSWFARLGISINVSSPYCPPGIEWNFPLQIVNNLDRDITIYPFTSLAQILFSNTCGTPISYQGKFQNSNSPLTEAIGDEIPETEKDDFKLIPKTGK